MEFGLNWAIIFPEDGLDEEGMKQYLSTENTKVIEIYHEESEIENTITGEVKAVKCVTFFLQTKGKIYVPPKFLLELNLKSIGKDDVYYPVNKDWA